MSPVYSPSSSPSPSFRRSALVHRDVAAGVEVRDVALRLGHALRRRAAHLAELHAPCSAAAAATGRASAATGRGRDGASAAAGRSPRSPLPARRPARRSARPDPCPRRCRAPTPRSRAIRRASGDARTRDPGSASVAVRLRLGLRRRIPRLGRRSGGAGLRVGRRRGRLRRRLWRASAPARAAGFGARLLRRRGRGASAPAPPSDSTAITAPTGADSPSGVRISASDALVVRLELHVRLVGLDLREDVADGDAIAPLLQPADDLALLHGVGELRHEDVGHRRRSARRRGGRTRRASPAGRACAGRRRRCARASAATSASRLPAYGIGTSRFVTRSGGASSPSKASRTTSVISSAATPANGHPSCTTTQ